MSKIRYNYFGGKISYDTRAVPKFCGQAAFLTYLTSLTNKTLTTSETNNFQ